MQRAASSAPERDGKGPRPLADCGSFAALAARAGTLDALDRALRQTLPAPLREQVKFADLRAGRLVFLASSPAWASRLRLAQTQLLAAAHAVGMRATAVTVKVAPVQPARVEPAPSRSLSCAAAAHLRAASASLTDPEMRELFLQMASLGSKA